MKPQVSKNNEIKNPKYRFSWYKEIVKLLRNNKTRDYRDKSLITLS